MVVEFTGVGFSSEGGPPSSGGKSATGDKVKGNVGFADGVGVGTCVESFSQKNPKNLQYFVGFHDEEGHGVGCKVGCSVGQPIEDVGAALGASPLESLLELETDFSGSSPKFNKENDALIWEEREGLGFCSLMYDRVSVSGFVISGMYCLISSFSAGFSNSKS